MTDETPSGDPPETLPTGSEDPILYTDETLNSYRPDAADHGNAMTVRTRNGRGKFARDPEVAKRDARCAELYARGRTYREIGDELGISVSQAYRGVQHVLAETVGDAGDELRRVEDGKLVELAAQAWDVLGRDHVTVSNGRVLPDILDDGPKLAAVQLLMRISESRRKLHGLDSPTRVTVDGGVRYEVVGIDPAALT